MLSVRRQQLQRADGQLELIRVRELPDAHSQRIGPGRICSPRHGIVKDVLVVLLANARESKNEVQMWMDGWLSRRNSTIISCVHHKPKPKKRGYFLIIANKQGGWGNGANWRPGVVTGAIRVGCSKETRAQNACR
jgi:hypothetical protein